MYVRVRVYPDSKKEVLQKTDDTHYEIQVKEPAIQNLANRRVRYVLAREFGVNESQVRIVSGHRTPTKIFDVITS